MGSVDTSIAIPFARARARWATLSTISSSRTSSSASPGFAPRASSTMSATSAVSSSSSATMSARSDSSSAAGSRSACSSVWMFARRLAIGVRSSWLASATSWRCASTERSSESSVVLKLRARRPSSSFEVTSIRCEGSGSPAISSVRRVKRSIGASAVRATTAASAAPSATPAAPTSSSTSSTRSSWRSTSSSGRATWIAPRLPSAAGQDAHVRARHPLVPEELARAAARERARAGVHRKRVARLGRADHAA